MKKMPPILRSMMSKTTSFRFCRTMCSVFTDGDLDLDGDGTGEAAIGESSGYMQWSLLWSRKMSMKKMPPILRSMMSKTTSFRFCRTMCSVFTDGDLDSDGDGTGDAAIGESSGNMQWSLLWSRKMSMKRIPPIPRSMMSKTTSFRLCRTMCGLFTDSDGDGTGDAAIGESS